MIIEIDCEEGAKIFDTNTGFEYRLFISCDKWVQCVVLFPHYENSYLLYSDEEAIQFWQGLTSLSGINPGWIEHQLSRLQNQIKENKNG